MARLASRLWRVTPTLDARLGGDLSVLGNVETQTGHPPYHWDGLKRGGNPDRPDVYFQYTLDGRGIYQDRTGRTRLSPGTAFLAVVPSEHRYYLPQDSPRWTFFWLRVQHPYIVARLVERVRRHGAILQASPTSRLILQCVDLLEHASAPTGQDRFERERMLFDLLIEIERTTHVRSVGLHDLTSIVPQVRKFVLDRLTQPVTVEELAGAWGMSRTRFSHFFRNVVGVSPARFITQVRLEEVQRRLTYTPQTLKQIATDCGFADANHLCKVFRRQHNMSPGTFRRQMRPAMPTVAPSPP